MRFLIECTYVYEHPEVNSGIQRVVRNIIGQLDNQHTEVECIPVMMSGGQIYQVLSLAPLTVEHGLTQRQAWIVKLDHLRNRYWWWHSRLERLWPFRSSKTARRLLYWPCKVASLLITLPLRGLLQINRNSPPAPQRAVPLQAQAGDQLILLDSSWHADFFPMAERLKSQGVGIISVVYDLIPLTHPQFCDAGLVKVFDRWFDWIAETADGFMAISKTISQQVEAEIQRRLGNEEAAKRWHGHFHLGSELDLLRQGQRVNADLLSMFRDPAPVYLMVSTIEPRKNHAYLLDAFDLLWANGSEARLCIIGKVGWKCEALIARIKQHPLLNTQLFMFNQINDKGLEYAYAHARALVFPSHVEGFGLPLVEAMQRGLPVMASDIPVFREVGGDFMAYFDLATPKSLADQVMQFESSGKFPSLKSVSDWQWIGWYEASQQLIGGTLEGLRTNTPRSSQPNAHCS
ncbi:glycosyltransferase family 1 protein [Pseudomonas sp.]|uniref:glycosyltransferase family 4 protein n=1 Tax=Pseudomonas sp. TaxID=306 RepID=UPI0019F115AA|nr:glycosyltransferase family 1 protein [Pseudomonas sp.]MBF0677165.1 glycosyltransferase family 4 protein [Pseudomonas sp.]